jgi:ribosomal protein L17
MSAADDRAKELRKQVEKYTPTGKKEPKTLCKECFEKYQKHEKVEHIICYVMIKNSGGLDVKGPGFK